MNRPDVITVQKMSGPEAAKAEQAFVLIYAEVFAEPPYYETPEDVAASFRRFRSQTRKSAFRAALARTEDGEPAGFAYGYPLSASTRWWYSLTAPVSEETSREDGERTFGLMEMAVRSAWRRRGVGRRLHGALLSAGAEERVLLNVHAEAEAALATYRSLGYSKVGETYPWRGATRHDVMVLGL